MPNPISLGLAADKLKRLAGAVLNSPMAVAAHGIIDAKGNVIAYGRDGVLYDADGNVFSGGAGDPEIPVIYTYDQSLPASTIPNGATQVEPQQLFGYQVTTITLTLPDAAAYPAGAWLRITGTDGTDVDALQQVDLNAAAGQELKVMEIAISPSIQKPFGWVVLSSNGVDTWSFLAGSDDVVYSFMQQPLSQAMGGTGRVTGAAESGINGDITGLNAIASGSLVGNVTFNSGGQGGTGMKIHNTGLIYFLMNGYLAGYIESGNGRLTWTYSITSQGYVRTASTTVAGLTGIAANAAAAGAGARAFVTDANSTTFGAIAVGGGLNAMPVYSDGTDWRIG